LSYLPWESHPWIPNPEQEPLRRSNTE
jgi:hypothetical protein